VHDDIIVTVLFCRNDVIKHSFMQEWVLRCYIGGVSLVLSSDSCSPGV